MAEVMGENTVEVIRAIQVTLVTIPDILERRLGLTGQGLLPVPDQAQARVLRHGIARSETTKVVEGRSPSPNKRTILVVVVEAEIQEETITITDDFNACFFGASHFSS